MHRRAPPSLPAEALQRSGYLRNYNMLVDADEYDETDNYTKSTGHLDIVLRRRLLAALAVSLDWVSDAELADWCLRY